MAQTTWKRSACPYDCPDGCGLLVETDGKCVYRVKGDPDHPVTRGFVCRKMQHYERTVHSPRRIPTPLRRVGEKGKGEFVPISWEEAVDEITTRWKALIAAYGAEVILPYSYAGTEHQIQYGCGEAFFGRLGASRLERTICAKAKDAGFEQIIGATPGQNPRDLSHCDYIIIWGSNVTATWIHAHSEILAAKKNGAHVVLIDVYATPAAALADEVLLVRPGTDAFLALAMDRLLQQEGRLDRAFLDRHTLGAAEFLATLAPYTLEAAAQTTAVPKETIASVARGFAAARSPVILFGAGMSRHGNGAMTIRCVTTLAAVTGAFAKPFGGIIGNASSSAAYRDDLVTRPDFQQRRVRSINMGQIGSALTELNDPPILSLYVYSSNPASIAPNQSAVLRGLRREDLFTVVHERFLTDTAKYADIVLPADTAMEHGDLAASYGNLCIQKTDPVIAPLGESKSNFETFALLGRAMDPELAADIDKLVLSHPNILGIHDLVYHDYGPGRAMMSFHVEVPAGCDLLEIHDVVDHIERELKEKHHIDTSIHMDPVVCDDSTSALREQVAAIARKIDPVLTIHDFRITPGPIHTNLIFDVMVPYGFRLKDTQVREQLTEGIKGLSGHYFPVIQVDHSYVERREDV